MSHLWVIEALDDIGNLTITGRKMVEFPCEPTLSKMIILSVEMGCSREVVTIVSMLSVPNVISRPTNYSEESVILQDKLYVPDSDHLTLLNIYIQWKRNNYSLKWCNDHFLHPKTLTRANEVRQQLMEIMK